MSSVNLIRSDQFYYIPLKPIITIQSRDGDDTYFTYDAIHNSSPPFSDEGIHVIYCDAERAEFETGSFNIVIEDSDNLIARDRLKSARVLISFGKDEDHIIPFIAGFSDNFELRRPRNNYMEYALSGPSTKSQAANVQLLVRRATSKANNPDYSIAQLVQDMIKKRKSRPLNRDDFEEVFNWSADLVSQGGLIDDGLKDVYYNVVNEVFTTLWDFYERMSALTGANWDIEYLLEPDGDMTEQLLFQYPPKLHSGVRIKSTDLATSTDNKRKTAYIKDGFSVVDNASIDNNVTTTVYTTSVIERKSIASQMSNQGFSDLSNKAIAQQIIIENDQRRITDLGFILSKIGNPSSPKDRVNGDIVLDDDLNFPRGQVLATFNIPLDDIKTSPRTIFVNDIDIKVRFLQGSNKIWVRLFQRSGVDDSDPNLDTLNTIRWHHNGVFNTVKSLYTATAVGGDYKLRDSLIWDPKNTNPLFTYTVFSKINRLISRTNPVAAGLIGVKERFVDTSFLGGDISEVMRFLSLYLSRVSKPRRSISSVPVSIPHDFLFKPYQGVSFEDSLSNTFTDLEVQRARVVISALSGERGIGTYTQELTLTGLANPLTDTCSCS